MFIIYGRKKARIKQFTHTQDSCKSCKAFDLNVKVYKDYYHIFYIPFFPAGQKTFDIRCNNCGEPNRDMALYQHYDQITKPPAYLFSGLILIVALLGSLFYYIQASRNERVKFVAAPQVGDVYGIRKDGQHYFLRLSQIMGDTVLVYHGHLMYSGYVSKMQKEDYFVKDDELIYTKKELNEMMEKDEIIAVERGYTDEEGFNQIR